MSEFIGRSLLVSSTGVIGRNLGPVKRDADERQGARGSYGWAIMLACLVMGFMGNSCHHPGEPARVVNVATSGNRPSSPSSSWLAGLADDYWRSYLEAHPTEATLLGVHGYDDQIADESPAGRSAARQRLLRLRTALQKNEVPRAALNAADQITRDLLAEQIDDDLDLMDCHVEEWSVDPRDGAQVMLLDLAGLQSVATPANGRALLARWRLIPRLLDQKAANLLRGLSAGKVSARSEVERVARQLDELLTKPDADWPLTAPPHRVVTGTWPAATLKQFAADLSQTVRQDIRPAFARYRQIIREQILPRARGDAQVGIMNIPGGATCYRTLARIHTSLTIDPDAVHQLGLDQLRRIRGEMQALGPASLGTADFGEIQKRLRGQPRDSAMFFHTRAEIESTARGALTRAQAAMPRFLTRLPRTPCDVKRLEPHEEKDAPIAYYRQPAVDGSRPGTYYVNTYDPDSRPRYESESLAFHEAVPGHHIQIALAQEMTGVPEFRKHLGVTSFVEGWGLYAEKLADELGLYSSPLTRMGRLSLEAWRAARLVVDTGIHARGWSREQAVRFLTDNTTVAANNIQNEVDRYIGWPGQALAYKLGELEILKLRAEARARMGAAFDLRYFHDAVLGNGAVSLPVLRDQIARWAALTALGHALRAQ